MPPSPTSSTRRFGGEVSNATATDPAAAPNKRQKQNLTIYTFSMGDSPAHLQVLSTHSLNELMETAFQVCDPCHGERACDHLWNVNVGGKVYESGDDECVSSHRADDATLQSVKLSPGAELKLEYDYGSTSKHTLTLLSIEPLGADASGFPRAKPMAVLPAIDFETDAVDLNEQFSDLNAILQGRLTEVGLFQVGRKSVCAYIEFCGKTMIMMPERPKTTLNHYLACLNKAASMSSDGMCDWQSIIPLPRGSRNMQRGFCDCVEVPNPNADPDLKTIFPKMAALAGYRKDKTIPKGFIRYKNGILQVVKGSGSQCVCPRAPKGTAFHGEGVYAPNPGDEVLCHFRTEFSSLHDMFCKVEGLLAAL